MKKRIEYTINDAEALLAYYPDLKKITVTVDKSALYKKIKAARELGIEIPGVEF